MSASFMEEDSNVNLNVLRTSLGSYKEEMVDRRKHQNFQAIPHYLTDALWQSFSQHSRERCQMLVLQHCWKLGMRCPSESTYSVILNMLLMACPGQSRSMSSFERYDLLQQMKRDWKRFKYAKKSEDHLYQEYVEVLPQNPDDLPDEYKLNAFYDGTWVPSRFPSAIFVLVKGTVYV